MISSAKRFAKQMSNLWQIERGYTFMSHNRQSRKYLLVVLMRTTNLIGRSYLVIVQLRDMKVQPKKVCPAARNTHMAQNSNFVLFLYYAVIIYC